MSIYIHVTAGVLWTVAFGLMGVAPLMAMPIYALAWALMASTVAALLTGWLMLRCERHRIETVARLAVQASDEHRRLESI